MVLIKNPITKNGQLRYMDIIKVFIFVMFLFALYSSNIQDISGFDTAFTLTSSGMVIFIFLAIGLQLKTNCLEVYHFIVDEFSEWILTYQVTWKLPRITIILRIEQFIEDFTTKQTQADYCVFRC